MVPGSLAILWSIANKIDDCAVRKELQDWIDENIVEIGCQRLISREQLKYLSDQKDSYFEYQKKICGNEIGNIIIKDFVTETIDNSLYGDEITIYKAHVLKVK